MNPGFASTHYWPHMLSEGVRSPMKTVKYLLIASAVIIAGSPMLRARETAGGPAKDPAALEAVNLMGPYLRSLPSF